MQFNVHVVEAFKQYFRRVPSTGRRVIGRWDLWLDLSAFQAFGKYDNSRHALKSSARGDAMTSRDH